MYKDLPVYIKVNSKKAQEYRTELLFSNWVNNQVILNRLAKLEAFLTKKPLQGIKEDIDKEAERIAAAGLKEIEAFYGEE
jgi:hypothetical protein